MRHPGALSRLCTAALCALASSCGGSAPSAESGSEWVGTIITEGNVTTVVNESGSVWGEPIELVEDLSIGVESGAEPYMFGRVSGIATSDDRIYVADGQLSVVRVYDAEGNHLFDFGRQGEGPGEFDDLGRLVVDPLGRVLVQTFSRVTVFDLDGNLLDTWPYRRSGADRFVTVGPGGTTYVPTSWSEGDERLQGYIAVAADGSEIDRITGPDYRDGQPALRAEGGGRTIVSRVPYTPNGFWMVLPSGATVAGAGEEYRFAIEHPDRRLMVERNIELPRIPEEERQWQTAYQTAIMRRRQPDWSWDAPPVPERMPAYEIFMGDRYGRVWAMRRLGFERASDCDPDPTTVEDRAPRPCLEVVFGFDVFDANDGRFLGQVPLPGWFRSPPYLAEDAVYWAVEDEAGTIMVKRFRIVAPNEADR